MFFKLLHGLTIGVRRVHMYASFYWHRHDFEHAYVDTYPHFFPTIFKSFQNFSGSGSLKP